MRVFILTVVLLLGPWAAKAVEPVESPGPHQVAWEAHKAAPTSPGLLAGSLETAIVPRQPRLRPPCRTVFGYLPYWESSENLRYDLLTHLACFAVAVNSDGTLGNDHGWPWTAVINTAHQHGVKVILVATLFNSSAIQTLITTPAYKSAFFANIKAKMLKGGADGLNIDFEATSGSWRKTAINTFMAELTAYLHAEIPGTEVTFAGPAVNWSNAWDLPALAASCDGIFIMGYAFSGSWSSTSGPTAPLTGGSINITNTVLTQYGEVTRNNPEKLVLGVPYYGEHFTTRSSAARSTVIAYQGSTRFRNTQADSEIYGPLWDEVSRTPWYRWHDGTNWHQVWWDNAASLGLKYELAQSNGLQGIGMWALNYDGTRPELWDELDRRFLSGCYTRADFDGDGDVDLEDFGHMQVCITGTAFPQTDPACQDTLLDADTDVDDADLAIFQGCFSGPKHPADPACDEINP